MNPSHRYARLMQRSVSILTMVAFAWSLSPFAYAQVTPPVNTVNDGKNVQGGNYYNTTDGKTTFVNTGGGGLHIQPGIIVTGKEVSNPLDPLGSLTGNGGTLHFYAPGSVIRIDGTINVKGAMTNGIYTGNGGRVFFDSAFVYNNGAIYADGANGGFIQFNTGSAVFAPGSVTSAKGMNGYGGTVVVNASGAVDVQGNGDLVALLDTSGRVIGAY
ncbi:MAG: hypothetical protein KTR14_04920, partial [Vampirovibrio sp.]|nr:hypothetical protein [Vampirovibrio sp.]